MFVSGYEIAEDWSCGNWEFPLAFKNMLQSLLVLTFLLAQSNSSSSLILYARPLTIIFRVGWVNPAKSRMKTEHEADQNLTMANWKSDLSLSSKQTSLNVYKNDFLDNYSIDFFVTNYHEATTLQPHLRWRRWVNPFQIERAKWE